MNSETIQVTYEAIDNPILRLLIVFMSVAVTGLIGAIVYLYRERQALQREMIDMNKEAILVYDRMSDSLTEATQGYARVTEALEDLRKELQHTNR